MNDREQLREKISEISNSEFPLIDFFNDIGRNKDPRYNKELAYQDIEKIYDVFIYYENKCKKLEKVIEILEEKLEVFVNKTKYGTPYIQCWQQSMGITEKEYELLKEVLGND